MKNIFYMFLIMILSLGINADDQDAEHTHENDYEEGCSNDLDDDMDGVVDGDDEDCTAVLAMAEDDDLMGGLLGSDISAYLVWGVGIALINSDFGSSGSGTATTD